MTQRDFVESHIQIDSPYSHPSSLRINDFSSGETFYSYAIKAPVCSIEDGSAGALSFVPLAEIKGTVKIGDVERNFRTPLFTTPHIKITTPGWDVTHRIDNGNLILSVKQV